MKNILILILVLLFTSCKYHQQEADGTVLINCRVCNCEEQEAARNFIKESIHAANNYSDEEMEDVIAQLEKTSIHMFCHIEKVKCIARADWHEIVEADSTCRYIKGTAYIH